MSRQVEILFFADRPNHERARELVERIADELGVATEIELREVPDAESAARLQFLGSPTVRVDGRDIEPGADDRRDFTLSRRVYQAGGVISGQPDPSWVRAALATAQP